MKQLSGGLMADDEQHDSLDFIYLDNSAEATHSNKWLHHSY